MTQQILTAVVPSFSQLYQAWIAAAQIGGVFFLVWAWAKASGWIFGRLVTKALTEPPKVSEGERRRQLDLIVGGRRVH